jgi:hypothetical protein
MGQAIGIKKVILYQKLKLLSSNTNGATKVQIYSNKTTQLDVTFTQTAPTLAPIIAVSSWSIPNPVQFVTSMARYIDAITKIKWKKA